MSYLWSQQNATHVHFRFLTLNDIDAAVTLREQAIMQRATMLPVAVREAWKHNNYQMTYNRLAKELALPESFGLIAEIQDGTNMLPIGFSHVVPHNTNVLYLERLYSHQPDDYNVCGIGTELLSLTEAVVRTGTHPNKTLFCEAAGDSHRFYSRQGWEEISDANPLSLDNGIILPAKLLWKNTANECVEKMEKQDKAIALLLQTRP